MRCSGVQQGPQPIPRGDLELGGFWKLPQCKAEGSNVYTPALTSHWIQAALKREHNLGGDNSLWRRGGHRQPVLPAAGGECCAPPWDICVGHHSIRCSPPLVPRALYIKSAQLGTVLLGLWLVSFPKKKNLERRWLWAEV